MTKLKQGNKYGVFGFRGGQYSGKRGLLKPASSSKLAPVCNKYKKDKFEYRSFALSEK